MADEALWTVQDLQQYLRVGRTLTWTLIARGEIPVVRVGRAIRLRPADVRAWTARQAGVAESELPPPSRTGDGRRSSCSRALAPRRNPPD